MPETELPPNDLVGRLLVSADGETVGLITDVLLDTATRTRVVSVELGSGDRVKLIPLLERSRQPGEVQVEFVVELIESAPTSTAQLDYRSLPEALDAAREHFGVPLWYETDEDDDSSDAEAPEAGVSDDDIPTVVTPVATPDTSTAPRTPTAKKPAAKKPAPRLVAKKEKEPPVPTDDDPPAVSIRPLLGSPRVFLVGWLLPFALVAGLFTVLVWPSFLGVRTLRVISVVTGTSQGLVLLAAILGGAVFLHAVQTPLYRILSGYLWWPPTFAEIRREGHLARKEKLLASAQTGHGVAKALARERAARYPADPAEVAPTLLGNAIRRCETYGSEKFDIDSQLLGEELRAISPDVVVRNDERARSATDFFVCLFYSLLLLTLTSFVALVSLQPGVLRLLLTFILGGSATLLSYYGAVASTDHRLSTVRALLSLRHTKLVLAEGEKQELFAVRKKQTADGTGQTGEV